MTVVREFDDELPRPIGIMKSEAFGTAWRSLLVAVRADYRLRTGEKLLAMTADTSIVVGVIGNVGKATNLPSVCGWNLVTGVAIPGVRFGRVQER